MAHIDIINNNDMNSKPENPNSPDINPLDFYVWGAMLHRYEQLSPRPRDIKQLKVALQRIWDDLPLEEIQAAVLSVRKRLSAGIRAEGGHFEHLLVVFLNKNNSSFQSHPNK